MSLVMFQRALVDLTLAPQKVKALQQGDTQSLAAYDLTANERERILSVVNQPGIAVHCSLSRGNRLETICGAFPMTCVLLEPVLRGLLDELWQEYRPANYQLAGEDLAFATMIERKMARGELQVEYLDEVFAYELACMKLTQRRRTESATSSLTAIVEFHHSPDDLLPPLSRLTSPPAGLPAATYRAAVRLEEERFVVEILDPATAAHSTSTI